MLQNPWCEPELATEQQELTIWSLVLMLMLTWVSAGLICINLDLVRFKPQKRWAVARG